MPDTLKSAGASCPKCGWYPCAEYRGMQDTRTRWTCNSCSAGGTIEGSSSPAPQQAPTPVKKHWRDTARTDFPAV